MSTKSTSPPVAASAETNGNADAPAAPLNGDKTPADATSEANIAATSLDAPALPPPSPSEETKNTGQEADLDMKATTTVEGAVSGVQVVAPEGDAAPSAKKGGSHKRRSSVVPEHKGKKLNKKKSKVNLNLDAQPGDYYWARMKGYPPWPAIVCDEEMLPASLLQNRPVTAMRPDGTYREDFQDGGKNAKDRTYAVMYLGTYEFAWTPNPDLSALDFADIDNAEQGKKSKQLWGAYELAKERHDLQHFKDVLAEHEEAVREDIAEQEKADAEKAVKAEKKAKRKSKTAEEIVDDDVEMEDEAPAEEGGKKAKPSKKRKKEADSEGETAAKPAKTPKTKLKVNLTKTTEGESATKSKTKPKASKAAKEAPKTPPMSEADKKQKREKEVLYFRHKLQKGFLSTDSPPEEAGMKQMAEHFTSLEGHEDLEHSIIRSTKIHKVLKAILKLNSIPKDEEYHFKQRSIDLLQKWQKILADSADGGEANGEGETVVESKDEDPKVEVAAGTGEEETAEEPKDEDAVMEEADTETKVDAATVEADDEAPATTEADAEVESESKAEVEA